MQTEPRYWFPAKRYGWGWGLPGSWQGWLVLAAFVGLLVAGTFIFPPGTQVGLFLAYVMVLCALLVAVCWLKGEPPRWRWGNDAGSARGASNVENELRARAMSRPANSPTPPVIRAQ